MLLPILFWIFAADHARVRHRRGREPQSGRERAALVVSFVGLAALFMWLDAFFIGVIQILVYAGAVMVLFLFIIMLLDFKAEAAAEDEPRRRRWRRSWLCARLRRAALSACIGTASRSAKQPFPRSRRRRKIDDVREVGMTLFSTLQPSVPGRRRAAARRHHRRGRPLASANFN